MSGTNLSGTGTSNYFTTTVAPSPYTSTSVFPSVSSTPTPNSVVFVGYSSIYTNKTGTSNLYDIKLIERDLLNAFYTRVGERVMRPDWGCKIWDWLMDPMTPVLQTQIIDEVIRICNLDTRLSLLNTQVFTYLNGIRIEMTLEYYPYNVAQSFTVTFENRQATYFGSSGNA
jgi:phage baseplate assembly protein W